LAESVSWFSHIPFSVSAKEIGFVPRYVFAQQIPVFVNACIVKALVHILMPATPEDTVAASDDFGGVFVVGEAVYDGLRNELSVLRQFPVLVAELHEGDRPMTIGPVGFMSEALHRVPPLLFLN
jgi:hypothetical protein